MRVWAVALVCGWLGPAVAAQLHFAELPRQHLPEDKDSTSSLLLGDVDGDGDPDLVCGNYGEQNRVLLNLLRQLDAPRLAILGRDYRLDFYARPGRATPLSFALPLVADAEARIPLPPFGTLGLDPLRMLSLPVVAIPPSSGLASVAFRIPDHPALTFVATQALIIPDFTFDTWRFTNVIADKPLRL